MSINDKKCRQHVCILGSWQCIIALHIKLLEITVLFDVQTIQDISIIKIKNIFDIQKWRTTGLTGQVTHRIYLASKTKYTHSSPSLRLGPDFMEKAFSVRRLLDCWVLLPSRKKAENSWGVSYPSTSTVRAISILVLQFVLCVCNQQKLLPLS